MLQALVDDAMSAQTIDPVLLACPDAASTLRLSGCTVQLLSEQIPVLDQLAHHVHRVDAVLPVAPECDGVLSAVSDCLHRRAAQCLLPPPEILVRLCDKWKTYDWFRSAGIPMVPTSVPNESVPDSWTICKPRLGAGCHGITRGRPSMAADSDHFICQPEISGRSLSVGILGNGNGHLVLPVAEQHVQWVDDHPEYRGGTVPARVPAGISRQIDRIVDRVLEELGAFRGYVGLDFLIADDLQTVLLNEANPRLCTSFVGYRHLYRDSLLAWMLSGASPVPTDPAAPAVRFHTSGFVEVIPDPA